MMKINVVRRFKFNLGLKINNGLKLITRFINLD